MMKLFNNFNVSKRFKTHICPKPDVYKSNPQPETQSETSTRRDKADNHLKAINVDRLVFRLERSHIIKIPEMNPTIQTILTPFQSGGGRQPMREEKGEKGDDFGLDKTRHGEDFRVVRYQKQFKKTIYLRDSLRRCDSNTNLVYHAIRNKYYYKFEIPRHFTDIIRNIQHNMEEDEIECILMMDDKEFVINDIGNFTIPVMQYPFSTLYLLFEIPSRFWRPPPSQRRAMGLRSSSFPSMFYRNMASTKSERRVKEVLSQERPLPLSVIYKKEFVFVFHYDVYLLDLKHVHKIIREHNTITNDEKFVFSNKSGLYEIKKMGQEKGSR